MDHSARALFAALLALTMVLAACTQKPAGRIDEIRVARADGEPHNWFTAGRDAGKTHFSPLTQINKHNITKLGFAWAFETGTNRVLEATPIVVDGVMFTSGPLGRVWALDARTGALLWRFTPQVDGQIHRGLEGCCLCGGAGRDALRARRPQRHCAVARRHDHRQDARL
jgi:quinohemoprotein ethanol dehydrogenase